MAWQDRDYNRAERDPGWRGPLMWLLTGSIPAGRLLGIEIRIHASFLAFVAFVLISPEPLFPTRQVALISSAMLYTIVLLHEFGHCLASRSVGGTPTHIMMTPIGGLAFTECPQRPGATLWTVAAGPLVNVGICIVLGVIMLAVWGPWSVPWLAGLPGVQLPIEWQDSSTWYYMFWAYRLSFILLLFNLLPIFPLDGGRILQCLLWYQIGLARSMLLATTIGIIGGIAMVIYGFVTFQILLAVIAVNGILTCVQLRAYWKQRIAMGDVDEGPQFDPGYYDQENRTTAASGKKKQARLQALAAEEQAESATLNSILDKVAAKGMASLSWWERRALKKATERQRQRDQEIAKLRRGR